jgi:two-component sensor histidine kinase
MNGVTDDRVPVTHYATPTLENALRHRAFRLSTLLSLLTLAVLSPLLLFGAYTLHVQSATDRAGELDKLRVLALDLVSAVDRELSGQIATAQMLAASRSLQRGDHLEFWRHAEDAASRANGHFILIDRDHQQLVNTHVAFGTRLPRTNNPDLTDAVLNAGEPMVSDLITVAASEEPILYTVRTPVAVDGVARYVLSYVPRRGAMLDVLLQSYRPEGWRAVVVDGSGRVIARSHQHDEFYGQPSPPSIWDQVVGHSGLISGRDLQDVPSLTAYQASSLSDWRVFVWVHESDLDLPAQAARRQLLVWAAFALAVALIAGWLAGRMIQNPTLHLVHAAQDMAGGRPVRCKPSWLDEANMICEEIAAASRTIRARESSLREAAERMRVVMRELSHRSLNLLTVVQLIAKQSGRLSRDHDDFMEAYNQRIAGLARSQDQLIATEWTEVSLHQLISAHLSPFIPMPSERVDLDGPVLMLRSQAVQNLGMGLHELATNALKYGALSVPEGRVSVTWSVENEGQGQERLLFRWRESGGPAVSRPQRRGFGQLVTDELVPAGVDGQARTELRDDGLVWELDAPLSVLVCQVKQTGG